MLLLLYTAFAAALPPEAFAMITGGEGNRPLQDPGWPAGAAAIFNVAERIAWWEGPPFGGGQWHAECRGNAKALNTVLADFAKLDVKTRRLIVHDGIGNSFWLNINNERDKRAAARIDWSFMVWQPENWKRLRNLPPDLNPTNPEDAATGPPAQIDVYTGGNIKWTEVIVPQGLKIVDQRLEAHGFSVIDGIVLEGKVTSLENNMPLAAEMRLELIETQPKAGYRYSRTAKTKADAAGHWVLKHTPPGWFRVVIDSPGFVPHVIGYLRTDDQPCWQTFNGGLARSTTVIGRIRDNAGKPLADVDVHFQNVTTSTGGRYESAFASTIKTDTDGRFRTDQVPTGKATIWIYKPGYYRPGIGLSIDMPKNDVELTMNPAGRIVVTVDFTGTQRPHDYIVNLEPEGGNAVGSYGGSGQINDKNQIAFENIPPGKYMLHGQPNPGSANQRTEPVHVDLKGGKTADVKLIAK
jgi:hypothetical protein